jgi:hypothetical protein
VTVRYALGAPHSGPKSQKPGHKGCSLIIPAVNSWFLMESCVKRFSRLLVMNLQFILQKNKMADPKWRQFFFKLTEFYQNQYMRFFEVAQYDLNINFSKNKMADPKWRTLFFKS